MRKLAIVALAAAALAASSAISGPRGEERAPVDEKCAVVIFYHSMSPDRPQISLPTSAACADGSEAAIAVTLSTIVHANHLPDGTPR